MSKICKIQSAFKRIEGYLHDHDLSLILFNNDSSIHSTKHGESHNNIFETIKNIQCEGTTDFGTIKDKLDAVNDSNTISIIISDGFHTDMRFHIHNSLEFVKESLENIFKFSIGIGQSFDEELLSIIGQEYICNNSYKTFDFLFKENKNILIPKDKFIFSEEIEFNIKEKEENDLYEEILDHHQEDSSYYRKLCIKKDDVSEGNKKHFIFVVDTSGSMDDSLLIRDNQENFLKPTQHFHLNEFKEDTLINVSFIPKEGGRLYVETTKAKDKFKNIYEFLDFIKTNEHGNTDDQIYLACKGISLLNKITDKKEKIERHHQFSFHNYFNYIKIKNFIKDNYERSLTLSEQTFNILLHSPIDRIYMDQNITKYDNSSSHHICSICYINHTEVLFSCNHSFCCFQCTLSLIDRNKGLHCICPICRQSCQYIRLLRFREENSKVCLQCGLNLCDVYYNPCSHIAFCVECSNNKNSVICEICNVAIESKHKVIFS